MSEITYPPELLPQADDGAEVFICCDPFADHSSGPCHQCELVAPPTNKEGKDGRTG